MAVSAAGYRPGTRFETCACPEMVGDRTCRLQFIEELRRRHPEDTNNGLKSPAPCRLRRRLRQVRLPSHVQVDWNTRGFLIGPPWERISPWRVRSLPISGSVTDSSLSDHPPPASVLHRLKLCNPYDDMKCNWKVTNDALNDMITFIHKKLDHPLPAPREADDDIMISHRVFTKVRSAHIYVTRSSPSQVTSRNRHDKAFFPPAADDPKGYVSSLSKDWRILDTPEFARRTDNGEVTPCDHLVFSRGDLVEVYVTFEVAETRSKRRPEDELRVHLSFNGVVQLLAASKVRNKYIEHCARHLTDYRSHTR